MGAATGWDGGAACALHLGRLIEADKVVTDGLSQDVKDLVAERMAEYERGKYTGPNARQDRDDRTGNLLELCR